MTEELSRANSDIQEKDKIIQVPQNLNRNVISQSFKLDFVLIKVENKIDQHHIMPALFSFLSFIIACMHVCKGIKLLIICLACHTCNTNDTMINTVEISLI